MFKMCSWNPIEEAKTRNIQGTLGYQEQPDDPNKMYFQGYFNGLNAVPVEKEVFESWSQVDQEQYLKGYMTGSNETWFDED